MPRKFYLYSMFDNLHGKYVYDALYRLTQAEGREKRNLGGAPGPGEIGIQPVPSGQNTAVRGYTEQYNYDELGNMLQIIHTSTRTQDSWNKYYHYTPTFTNNFLQSTSTDNVAPTLPDYTYDAHGNMLQMPHLSSMSWDFADRLQSANIGGNAMVYFTYDANGERVRKVRVNASGRRWERIYLGSFEMYRIVNGNGNLRFERQTLHISDNQSRVALVDTLTVDDGNTIANPVSVQRYQLNNHLESASLELDENADIISYEEYYPFGSTSYRAGRSNSEVNAKRYRYVGKEKDDETGLYYYGARYYASWLARFVSVDPLKDDYPFYTSYQYAGNKPVTFIDLDGLETTDNQTTNVQTNGQQRRFDPEKNNPLIQRDDNSGFKLDRKFLVGPEANLDPTEFDVITHTLEATITVRAGLRAEFDIGLIGGALDIFSFKIGEIKATNIFDKNFNLLSSEIKEFNFLDNDTGILNVNIGARGELIGGLSKTNQRDFDVHGFVNDIIKEGLPDNLEFLRESFEKNSDKVINKDKADILIFRGGSSSNETTGELNSFGGIEEDVGFGTGLTVTLRVKFLRNVKNPTTTDLTLREGFKGTEEERIKQLDKLLRE